MANEAKSGRRADEVTGERQKTKKNRRTRRSLKPKSTRGERAVANHYEPTPEELDAVRAQLERRKRKPPMPGLKTSFKGGVAHTEPNHEDSAVGQVLLMEAFGTTDNTFLSGLIGQLLNAGTQGQKADERGLNFMLSLVRGIEPRDEVEAMLASQMAAVHNATMTFARRLAHVETVPQQDSAERAFNKLARTFAAQMEALRKYRTGGEQNVTVKHVTVNDGARPSSEMSNAAPEGGGPRKTGGQPHERTVSVPA